MRATRIEKLGDKEYKKLLEEIDQMSPITSQHGGTDKQADARDSRKVGSGGTGKGSRREMKNSKPRQTWNVEGYGVSAGKTIEPPETET